MNKLVFCASLCIALFLAACDDGNSVTDSRDGRTYKTVTIGNQTWMAENLNFETANSYCFNNDVSNCAKYGRLYTWAAAMDSAGTWSTNGKGCGNDQRCSPKYPVRGVCPSGWHLPDSTEWNTLFSTVGGKSVAGGKLKSTSGWFKKGNGTDDYSFTGLPAGFCDDNGRFGYEVLLARFWSSTEDFSYHAYFAYLGYDVDSTNVHYFYKNYRYSVRCVKDE